jgi:hypothetical protein
MRDFRRPSRGSDTLVAPLPSALTTPVAREKATGGNHTPTTTYALARPYAFPLASRDEPVTVRRPRPALRETTG